MAQLHSQYRLTDWSGGLNTRDDPQQIADNEISGGQNVDLRIPGRVTYRRKAHTTHYAVMSGSVQGIYVYNKANGSKYYLMVAGGNLYSRTQVGTYVSSNPYEWGTAIETGLNQSEDVAFYTVNDTCYMINGKDYARKYDGTTVSTVTGIPLGKYAAVLHNRVFIAASDAYPGRVFYSDIATPETFQGTSWFPADSGTMGDPIMGLGTFYDYLIIARRKSIHRADVSDQTTPANWIYQVINDRYGCVSGKTLSVFGDSLVFASDDGVYAISPTNVESYLNIVKLSSKIDPTYAKFKNKHLMASISFDQRYYLSVCEDTGGSMNDTVYIYDYSLKAWYPRHCARYLFYDTTLTPPYDQLQCDLFYVRCWVADGVALYGGNSRRGTMAQYDVDSDFDTWVDGTGNQRSSYDFISNATVPSYFDTRAMSGVDERGKLVADRYKRWRYVYPYANVLNEAFGSIDYRLDGGTQMFSIGVYGNLAMGAPLFNAATSLFDTSPFDGSINTATARMNIAQRSKQLTLRVSLAQSGIEFLGLTAVYVLEKRR